MQKGTETTLTHRLRSIAQAAPDHQAIADSSGSTLTYRELLQRSEHLANWLTATRADESNIGIYLPSSTAAAIANYAITLAGKVAINLNFTAGEQHCRAAIELCGLKTIFTSRAFLDKQVFSP